MKDVNDHYHIKRPLIFMMGISFWLYGFQQKDKKNHESQDAAKGTGTQLPERLLDNTIRIQEEERNQE